MNIFGYLLFAHLVMDYPLQGDFMAREKARNNLILLTHCMLWTLGVCAALTFDGMYSTWQFWWLFIGHLIMDFLKSRGHIGRMCEAFYFWLFPDKRPRPGRKPYSGWMSDPLGLPLWINQLWHVLQLAGCVIGFVLFR